MTYSSWKSDLGLFFSPASVALIGASEQSALTCQIFKNLKAGGFRGKIFPIHPRNPTFLGHDCFPSLSDVPGKVDFALFLTPARLIPDLLQECGRIGVRGALVFSSGFEEAGDSGRDLARIMRQRAEEARIHLCGPNCFGVVALHEAFAPYMKGLPSPREPGSVAVVSQSGGLSWVLFRLASDRGLDLSYVISPGNESVIESTHYLEYLIEDSKTEIILLVMESLRQPDEFRRLAARAVEKQKPIIVLKLGRSERGRQATASHTGSLATSGRVYEGFFRQNGVIEVDDLDDLIETALLFRSGKRPSSAGVGFITTSGGRSMLLADLAEEIGVETPDFSAETHAELAGALPPFSSISNPMDLTGQANNDLALHGRCVDILMREERFSVLVFCRETPRGGEVSLLESFLLQLSEASKVTDKLIIALSVGSENINEYGLAFRKRCAIPFLQNARRAVRCIRSLVWYADYCTQHGRDGARSETPLPGYPLLSLAAVPAGGIFLNEPESKRMLSELGISIPRGVVCHTDDDLQAAARTLAFPLVIKVVARNLPHKAAAGGVRLGINSADELLTERASILGRLRQSAPELDVEGFLVEEMVPGGLELILGASCDPQFGPVVVLGLGGGQVELRDRPSVRVPPLRARDVIEMLTETRVPAYAGGILGKAAWETVLPALSDTVLRFADAIVSLTPRVSEVDINPLIVTTAGVTAVDALVVLKGAR